MTKIYAIGFKYASGKKRYHRGSMCWFNTKEEAVKELNRMQSIARFEKKHKKCMPQQAGMLSVECEYKPEYQIEEFYLLEAERPEWKLIGDYDLEVNIDALL